MHSTYQINANLITGTLANMAKSAAKPAPKARDNTRQQRVMADAWKQHRVWLASNPDTTVRYRRIMFSHHLHLAHGSVTREDHAHLFSVTSDESRFIGSDSRWR
ncbi:hypothetical protein [Ochrobactrum sp. EDr1-4]|uniref:hypothetical protein n=1 Tax=Ochrobactrum sp. EDr1-4 TaxID=3368622 RepID=UPI003BA29E08